MSNEICCCQFSEITCSFAKFRENSFCPCGAENPENLPVRRNFTQISLIRKSKRNDSRQRCNVDHLPNSSIQSILHLSLYLSYLEESFCLDTIYSAELLKSRLF